MIIGRPMFSSIKHRMIFLFLTISILSIGLVALFSHYYYSKAVKEDFDLITAEAASRLNHHLEFYFKLMKNSTNTLINTNMVQSWLQKSYIPQLDDITDIEMEMKSYVSFNFPEIINMYLVSEDKRVLPLFNDLHRKVTFEHDSWFQKVPTEQTILLPTERSEGAGPYSLYMIIPINSTDSLAYMGNLVVQFSLAEIETTINKSGLGKTGYFFILSEEDTFIYHPNKEWISEQRKNTEMSDLQLDSQGKATVQQINHVPHLVSYGLLERTGWKIVSYVPYSEMANNLQAATKAQILVFAGVACIMVLLIPVLLHQFIDPIKHIKSLMEQVAIGNLKVRSRHDTKIHEFQVLNYSFNNMTEQLNVLWNEVAHYKVKEVELQLQQSEATIKALQNQINPHLLYNTLDIIKSIAYLEDVPLIEKIAHNLADVYRYAARDSSSEVTLEEELQILTKYLEIVHIRYPKKFESSVRVNKRFYQTPIMKLSLQPLVENAVKYAVEPKGGDAAIIVTAFESEGDLIIEIADNGPGIQIDKMAGLEEQFSNRHFAGKSLIDGSIGLYNVHSRLCLQYGDGYGVHAASFPERGSVVSIKIPFSKRLQ